ncbi:MAG: hypothetical protein E7182_00650 [Erysipelotrichaceae bacterium]|nr:hypothetical protein [Erysipelotrichaceae bacterium]
MPEYGVTISATFEESEPVVQPAIEDIDISALGFENQQVIEKIESGICTVTWNKGTNSNTPKYYTNGAAIRIYGGGYFVVSVDGGTISSIALTFGSSDGSNDIVTDVGSYENGAWSGSASSVKFTIGGTSGNRRIAGITITYTLA